MPTNSPSGSSKKAAPKAATPLAIHRRASSFPAFSVAKKRPALGGSFQSTSVSTLRSAATDTARTRYLRSGAVALPANPHALLRPSEAPARTPRWRCRPLRAQALIESLYIFTASSSSSRSLASCSFTFLPIFKLLSVRSVLASHPETESARSAFPRASSRQWTAS